MKSIKKKYKKVTLFVLNNIYLFTGLQIVFTGLSFKKYKNFKQDLKKFKTLSSSSELFPITKFWPVYSDMEESAGTVSQYFYQDLFVAQRIFLNNPKEHVDIGSRVDGFVANVASYRKIIVFDIRPLKLDIPNIEFRQADLMKHEEKDKYESVSCLHVLEHFGLGRYGDPINPDGHLIGLHTISAMLKKGGKFYLSVPMGKQRIEFHAHRVFSVDYLKSILQDDFIIDHFSYINDSAQLFMNVDYNSVEASLNFNCSFGCAIFELTKK